MFKKLKNWILTLIFGTACLAGGFGATDMAIDKKVEESIYKDIPKAERIYKEDIAEPYQIKTLDKRNILQYGEVDWIVEKLDKQGFPTGEFENKGKIIKYDCITDTEIKKLSKNMKVEINQGNGTSTVNAFAEEILDRRAQSSETYKLKDSEGNVLKNEKGEDFEHFTGYSGDNYIKKADTWFQLEREATTTLEAFDKQVGTNFKDSLVKEAISFFKISGVMATDVTYYSGAGDGRCYNVNISNWDTSHDAVSSTYAKPSDTTAGIYQRTAAYVLGRGFLPVDTSALPDDAIISSAKMTITIYNNTMVVDDSFALVQTFQNSNTTLVVGDFEDCGSDNGTAGRAKYQPVEGSEDRPTVESGVDVSGDTKVWTLNSTGRGWISKTSYTKLGIRSIRDADDAGSWTASEVAWYMSEYTGTTKDPKLEITYTAGTTFTPKLLIL